MTVRSSQSRAKTIINDSLSTGQAKTNGHTHHGDGAALPTVGEGTPPKSAPGRRTTLVGQLEGISPEEWHGIFHDEVAAYLSTEPPGQTDRCDGCDRCDGLLGGEEGWDWRSDQAKLLGSVYCYLADYIIMPPTSLFVVTTWVMAAYFADLWDSFPHLAITSPVGRCGKSFLLELLSYLGPKPWPVLNPTPPVIFRRIKQERPTVLYDEAQAMNRGDKSENNAILYELFCAGIKRNASIPRCEPDGKGGYITTDFPIYCPKAIALIGRLKGILADRCLPIALKRKTDKDSTVKERQRQREKKGKDLAVAIENWAAKPKVRDDIANIHNDLALFDIDNDRFADMLLPLQAVLVKLYYSKDSYPYRLLREYARQVEQDEKDGHNQSTGIKLLAALREIFAPAVAKQEGRSVFVLTEDLLSELYKRAEEGWNDYYGKPLTSEKLAFLLKEFGIKSARQRCGTDKKLRRGYHSCQFKDAWGRYFPAPAPNNPSHLSHPSQEGGE